MGYKVNKIRIWVPFDSEYQKVDYIQTSGTQWINTNLFASNTYQVETKIETASTETEKTIFGSLSNTTTSQSYNYYNLINYLTQWYRGINGGDGHGGSFPSTSGVQYEIVFNNSNNQVKVNGTEIGSCSGTVGYSGSTLCISARGGTNERYYGKYKYFYFNVYDKSESKYIMKLIPCYRKSDSVIGMYDLIGNKFYTNAGSGTFIKGSDVSSSDLIEKQIRPSGIQYSVDFRNNSKSNLESEGWIFDTSNFSFSSNGVNFTSSGYGNIYRIIDTTNCKKVKLSGTGYLSSSSGYYGIGLKGANSSIGFISWLYKPNGLGVWYNDENHYTGVNPGRGNFSWDIEVDLSTGNFISTCNNGQSVTGTLNSTYLSAIKQRDSIFGAAFNENYGYFQTLSITAE